MIVRLILLNHSHPIKAALKQVVIILYMILCNYTYYSITVTLSEPRLNIEY